MNAEIILKAQSIGLTQQRIKNDVQVFLDVNGDDMTLRALEMADASMRKVAKTGMHSGTALKNWRWATRKIIADIQRNEIQARFDEEKAASVAAYKATIKKGYVPNRPTILAQLEQQYADGEISIHEYNWGMAGLPNVHDIVVDGVKAEAEADPREDSQEDLPF